MLLSWHKEALKYSCTAFACRTTDVLHRQRCHPCAHSVSPQPPREPLLALRIRRSHQPSARCRSRGTGGSDSNSDSSPENVGDGDSNAKRGNTGNGSTGSSFDQPTGLGNSWEQWGFRFGVFRPSGSKSSEEERAAKSRQAEWERWQRSWAEVHASLQHTTMN